MEVSEKEVETYVRPDGSCPFEDWMTSLRDHQGKSQNPDEDWPRSIGKPGQL
jgi:hypothetical protein